MAQLPHGNATIRGSLARALAGITLDARDVALVHLADRYARELDDGGDLAKLGPGFTRALAALGLTPEARKAVVNPPSAERSARDQLDEFRRRRAGAG